jgi:hypothetical protein
VGRHAREDRTVTPPPAATPLTCRRNWSAGCRTSTTSWPKSNATAWCWCPPRGPNGGAPVQPASHRNRAASPRTRRTASGATRAYKVVRFFYREVYLVAKLDLDVTSGMGWRCSPYRRWSRPELAGYGGASSASSWTTRPPDARASTTPGPA